MIISKTPYRISFFGGGTDYPEWYLKNGGEVLSTSINKYLYLSCRYLPNFFNYKYRIAYSLIENAKEIKDIKHPVVKKMLEKYYNDKKGLEIHYDGDLPARSGMGSSSVFIVGFLNLLNTLRKKNVFPKKLANESIYFEQKILKETVGSQDQIATAYGGFNSIKFFKDGTYKVNKILINKEKQKILFNNLYLVYTQVSRTATWIAKSYVNKFNKSKKNYLEEISNHVHEAKDLLKKNNFDDFGKLLNQTWLMKKKLSNKVTNSHIDSLYEAGLKFGALGGKLLGAGGGGFVLFYVPKRNRKKFYDKFKKQIILPITISNEGSRIIFNNEGPA